MAGVFCVPLLNTGVERTPNKSQHTKLTLENIILLPLLPGFELAIFRSRVRCSNQQAVIIQTQLRSKRTYTPTSTTAFETSKKTHRFKSYLAKSLLPPINKYSPVILYISHSLSFNILSHTSYHPNNKHPPPPPPHTHIHTTQSHPLTPTRTHSAGTDTTPELVMQESSGNVFCMTRQTNKNPRVATDRQPSSPTQQSC